MGFAGMSIAGGLMAAAAAGIRWVSAGRIPKRVFYFLWWMILLRFLVPASIPLPVHRGADPVQTAVYIQTGEPSPSGYAVSGEPVQPEPARFPFAALWGVGAAACGMFFLVLYGKSRKEFARSQPVGSPGCARWLSLHRLIRPISIRSACGGAAPLTYGILRPVILMPSDTDWADAETLPYILEHEYIHIRRFDTAYKMALAAALCLHWFNPLAWLFYILANRDTELSCDEAVIRSMGKASKQAYALALIRMEERKTKLSPFSSHFSKNAAEERINAIMSYQKSTVFSICAAFIMSAGLLAGFASPVPASPAARQETEPYMVYDNNCYYILCDGAEENEKPTGGVSDGFVGLVLVYPDGYISIGPLEPDESLPDQVESQCQKMLEQNRITKGQADLLRKAAQDILLNGVPLSQQEQEYQSWGISSQDGVYYYQSERLRILMDLRPDNSFANFRYDGGGTVDLRLIRDADGAILRVESIPEEQAQEILWDLKTADPEDISRLTKEQAPQDIQKAVSQCASGQWTVIEGRGRQYLYYGSLPANYAYQYYPEEHCIKIVDISWSTAGYVLLSVPRKPGLSILYQSEPVAYTTVTLPE